MLEAFKKLIQSRVGLGAVCLVVGGLITSLFLGEVIIKKTHEQETLSKQYQESVTHEKDLITKHESEVKSLSKQIETIKSKETTRSQTTTKETTKVTNTNKDGTQQVTETTKEVTQLEEQIRKEQQQITQEKVNEVKNSYEQQLVSKDQELKSLKEEYSKQVDTLEKVTNLKRFTVYGGAGFDVTQHTPVYAVGAMAKVYGPFIGGLHTNFTQKGQAQILGTVGISF